MTYFRKITALILLLIPCMIGFTQILEVSISNIRSGNGQLLVALFDSEAGFRKEQPFFSKAYPKNQINFDSLVLLIPITAGVYGLSVLDDENMDGKMNYNRIGLPLEGFGFSDYKHKGIRRPAFKNFIFSIEVNQLLKVDVVLKYF